MQHRAFAWTGLFFLRVLTACLRAFPWMLSVFFFGTKHVFFEHPYPWATIADYVFFFYEEAVSDRVLCPFPLNSTTRFPGGAVISDGSLFEPLNGDLPLAYRPDRAFRDLPGGMTVPVSRSRPYDPIPKESHYSLPVFPFRIATFPACLRLRGHTRFPSLHGGIVPSAESDSFLKNISSSRSGHGTSLWCFLAARGSE